MEKLRTKSTGLIIFSDYKKLSYKITYAIMILFLVFALVISVFPPLWLLLSSFKTSYELYKVPFTLIPDSFKFASFSGFLKAVNVNFHKIGDLWDSLQFGKYYINSFIMIIGAVICSVFFNGLLAYAISVIKPAGYKIIFGLVMGSLMIPAILNMGPLLTNIANLNLTGTYIPLWLVYGANPFYFIMFKVYFDQLPYTLFEAAELDGCNKLQIFTKLIVPLSMPIIMVIAIFTVNAAWSDFLLPYLVLQSAPDLQTVMVKIYVLQANMGTMSNFGPDKLLMVIAMSIIPPIILFTLFQKQITSSVATTGMKD